jgi:hypothetical protein
MHKRYYAANDGKALLQVTTELGKNNIQISVGNSNLDWHSIILNEEQSIGFKKFMRENDI